MSQKTLTCNLERLLSNQGKTMGWLASELYQMGGYNSEKSARQGLRRLIQNPNKYWLLVAVCVVLEVEYDDVARLK